MGIKTLIKFYERQIHCPSLILCSGSVFFISNSHPDMARMITMKWTLTSLAIMGVYGIYALAKNRSFVTNPDKIVKTYFLLGLIEVGISLLQLIHVVPSFNRFYRLTGTFSNPTLLGMQLCLCLPIGINFILKTEGKRRRAWCLLTSAIVICMVMSTSRTCLLASILSTLTLSFFESTSIHEKLLNRNFIFMSIFIITILLTALYFWKRDSADGRILIWIVSLDMIKEKFLLGWGQNGFDSFYMQYQASYFLHHPNSRYLYLADNVFHPFNEILLLLIKYGFIGIITISFLIFLLIKCVITNKSKCKSIYVSLTVIIGTLSMFSYPSTCFFIWLVSGFLILSVLCSRQASFLSKICSFIYSIFLVLIFFQGLKGICSEWRWLKLQNNYHHRNQTEVMNQYSVLYNDLKDSSYFLYNYGAVLHSYGNYEKSLDVFMECERLYNDYNIQMLMADNFRKSGNKKEAIKRLRFANNMIPNRFLPLYYEMEIYKEDNDSIKAYNVAMKIINKSVKIKNSHSIRKIKEEAKKVIEESHGNL